MSTITAFLTRPPRTLGSHLEPVSNRFRRAAHQLQRWNEGLVTDRYASPSELTLRPYTEARFHA
ncbi:MAG: hypothetical protein HKN24_03895 [Acidimicrobiales bacterium]|nr:hypothetical protein [Acidimicrobiales bacterium]